MKSTNVKIEIDVYVLPAYWASALINDDRSGLEDRDEEELNEWLTKHKNLSCVGCEDETILTTFNGLLNDCLTYTFRIIN